MKMRVLFAALTAAWSQLGVTGGVLRTGSEAGGNVPAELPFQSLLFRPHTVTAAFALTEIEHAGRTIVANAAAGVTYTLPRATGSGARFRFRVKVTITSVGLVIKVANTDDQMIGNIMSTLVGTATTVNGWQAVLASAFDTITLNGTTTGGISGDWIEIEDVATGFWAVSGSIMQSGTGATPFTATV